MSISAVANYHPESLDDCRVLQLNADFRPVSTSPLSTLGWQDAIKGVIEGKLSVVAEYDNLIVRSEKQSWNIPSVVANVDYINLNRPAAKTRWNLMLAYEFKCAYCDTRHRVEDLTYDHVIPKSRGGRSDWSNLVPACHKCNMHKSNRTPQEAHMPLLHKPRHPTYAKLNALGIKYMKERTNIHKTWLDYLYWGIHLSE